VFKQSTNVHLFETFNGKLTLSYLKPVKEILKLIRKFSASGLSSNLIQRELIGEKEIFASERDWIFHGTRILTFCEEKKEENFSIFSSSSRQQKRLREQTRAFYHFPSCKMKSKMFPCTK
jgi:hypothetical protein